MSRSNSQNFNPLQQQALAVHAAFERLGHDVQIGLHDLEQRISRPIGGLVARASGFVNHHLQQLAARNVDTLTPAFASVAATTRGASSSRAASNPVFELAATPDEIKRRLSAVPVYAVVNADNEFVLASGEGGEGGEERPLGLFFFNRADAEGMVSTIKEQNSKVGKTAKVITTSMDAVYEFAVTPRNASGTEGVVFRFMPDAAQVENALELCRHAGLSISAFTGVPLFQAEGLTVRGESARYTPLFFSKEDLDVALSGAFAVKESEAQREAKAKADRARSELQDARAEASAAADGRAKRSAQKKVDAAQKRVEKYEGQLAAAVAKTAPPRVDVGSLEEVLVKMEADTKGEWGDVMFVPPGALLPGGAAQGREVEKGKRK